MGRTTIRLVARATLILSLACLGGMVTSSCGLLLVPKRGHTNPLDPDNPVALIEDFAARKTGAVEITLTWTLPAEKLPDKIVITRKVGSAPTSVGDGTRHDADDPYALSLVDDSDYGLEAGKVYWYAAWSYSSSANQMTGPVLAGATTITVPALASFNAVAMTPSTVQLTWALPATADAGYASALIVRRKAGSDPTGPTDGVAVPVTLENGVYVESIADRGTFHYAAWTVDATGGSLGDPLYDTASTVFVWRAYAPSMDGFVRNGLTGSWTTMSFGYDYISVDSYSRVGLIAFGYLELPPYFTVANLYLYCNYGAGYSVTLGRIVAPWSVTTVTYDAASSAEFIDQSTSRLVSYGTNDIDITGLVEAWAAGATNYGLRIKGSESYFDFSSLEGSRPPSMAVYCSEEFQ